MRQYILLFVLVILVGCSSTPSYQQEKLNEKNNIEIVKTYVGEVKLDPNKVNEFSLTEMQLGKTNGVSGRTYPGSSPNHNSPRYFMRIETEVHFNESYKNFSIAWGRIYPTISISEDYENNYTVLNRNIYTSPRTIDFIDGNGQYELMIGFNPIENKEYSLKIDLTKYEAVSKGEKYDGSYRGIHYKQHDVTSENFKLKFKKI